MRKALFKSLLFVTVALLLFAGLVALRYTCSHALCPADLGFRGLRALGGADILLLGSSLTRMAYDPRVLEERTGRRAYVLAYNGLDPVYVHAVLEPVLAEPALRPDLLVLEAAAGLCSVPPDLRDKNLFVNAPPALKGRLLELLRSRPDGLPFPQFYDLVVSTKNADLLAYPLTAGLLARSFYHGAHRQAPATALSPAAFAAIKPLPSDLQPALEVQLQALDRILALTRAHGIRTVFVVPALPSTLADLPEIRAHQARLTAHLEAAGASCLDGSLGFAQDDPACFADGRHLSAYGRRLYTENLAARLFPPEAMLNQASRP